MVLKRASLSRLATIGFVSMTTGFEVLAPELVEALPLERGIVMLWSLAGDRILAASRPALRFFGVYHSEDLTGRRFGPALPSTARIAEIGRFLSVGEPARHERLRFFLGRRSDLMHCRVSRVPLLAGGDALLICAEDAMPRREVPVQLARRALEPDAPAPASDEHDGQAIDEPVGAVTMEAAAPEAGALEIAGGEQAGREMAGPQTAVHPAAREPSATVEARPALPRRPVRFVFETDAAGRIARLSPQLAEIVGADHAALEGRTFGEAASQLRLAGTDAITAPLARGESWQGVPLDWPLAGSARRVLVELSGLPVLDAERRARGFRGFGVIRLDLLGREGAEQETQIEADRERAPGEPAALDTAPDGAAAAREPAVPVPAQSAPTLDIKSEKSVEERARDGSSAPKQNSQHSQGVPSTNVIALNPPRAPLVEPPVFQPINRDVPPQRPGPRLVTSEGDAERRLSQSDRNTFREIARALGARLIDDEPERSSGTKNGSERAGTAPERPAEAERPADAVATLPGLPSAEDLPAGITPHPDGPHDHGPHDHDLQEHDLQDLDLHEHASHGGADRNSHEGSAEPTGSDEIDAAARNTPTEEVDEPTAPERYELARAVPALPDLPVMTLIDHLPIGVMVLRPGAVAFANRTLLDLVGAASLADLAGRGEPEAMFEPPLPVAADPAEHLAEHRLRLSDGSNLDVLAHAQTIDWQGEPARLVSLRGLPTAPAAAQNIAITPSADSERQTLEARQRIRALETEREEYRAILDTATDGVVSLDAEGRIIGLNRSAEALFGVDQNEVAGQRFTMLFAGESHASAFDYLEGLKSGGVASVLNDGREVVGREKKGGRIPLFMTLGRVSEGERGRFCAVLKDLTAWKKAEAELTESKRVAERASQMKSDFLAKISHEIRTPMNAIIGFAEVMRTEQFGPIGSDRYREYLGDIHRSGEHVISLVNDLLDLSKIEAGRAELSFTSVSLNDIVADCVSMMQPQAAREKVIMRMNLAERMPNVVADERSIKQVVLNLLSNACKFNQPGGQVIVSTAISDQDEAVIRVRDTGIGMSDKDIEGAMQPFRQMSPTRRGGGTGLGLPLSKALVEANRASLTIRSAPREGTLAEVVFPATRVLAE